MASTESSTIFGNYSENPIFNSEVPLSYEHIPEIDDIVGRGEEIKKLTNTLQRLPQGEYAVPFMMTGDTGYGKTTVVKSVLDELETEMTNVGLDFVYTYIEDRENEREVLRKLTKDLDLDYNGSDLSMYYQRLREEIKERDLNYTIVLDDIDALFNKNGRKDHGNTVLKKLYEARKDVMNNSDGSLLIIGVTNNANITTQLDPKNRSRYADDAIQFSPYNANQLRQILTVRAEKAFKSHALEEGVVGKIAAQVAQGQGDARKAIRILRKAGKIAENNEFEKVRKKHVDEAKVRVERESVLQTAKNLPKQKKIMLYSILEEKRKSPKYKHLFSKYERVCRNEDVNPVGERQRRNIIEDLDMLGLISTETVTVKDGRGNTNAVNVEIEEEEVRQDFVEYMDEEVFGYE